jgi:hypothetical protein
MHGVRSNQRYRSIRASSPDLGSASAFVQQSDYVRRGTLTDRWPRKKGRAVTLAVISGSLVRAHSADARRAGRCELLQQQQRASPARALRMPRRSSHSCSAESRSAKQAFASPVDCANAARKTMAYLTLTPLD